MEPPTGDRGDMAGVSVLYVEDEPLVEMATTDVLEGAGLRVLAAPDARKALALLHDHPEIDLIITDVGLPGMSGYDFVAEARRAKPQIKVVFVTGYDRNSATDKRAPDAATDYVDKPYEPEMLVHSVRRLLGGRDGGAKRS